MSFASHILLTQQGTRGLRPVPRSYLPGGSGLIRDRDAEDTYLLMVEFSTYDEGMENANRPETGEFAAFLAGICDGHLAFRNLDLLRDEDL